MKRLGLIILILTHLTCLRVNAAFTSSLTSTDSSLVKLITTQNDTLLVKIIKIDLDNYYVLPVGYDRIIRIHKDHIKRLIYPDGLLLNVADNYNKGRGTEVIEMKLIKLSLLYLIAFIAPPLIFQFSPFSPMFYIALIIANSLLPSYIVFCWKTTKYNILLFDYLWMIVFLLTFTILTAFYDAAFLYFI